MELRVNGEADAIDIGTGFIPEYEDLECCLINILIKNIPKKIISSNLL